MKNLIKKLVKLTGYEIRKLSPYGYKYEWIKEMDIKSILDVGANQGQYAVLIAKEFPNAKIYSFEPVKGIYEMLEKNTKHLNIKTFNVGLGDKKENLMINHTVYGNFTSSILEMGENHMTNFSQWTKTQKEEIAVITLDDFIEETKIENNILLKLDVQGYEDKVLIGAENAMKRTKIIQMEVTFMEMYKGEKLFEYHFEYLKKRGFKLMGFMDNIYDIKTGQPHYADAFFVRE